MSNPLLVSCEGIKKNYLLGKVPVEVLKGVSLEVHAEETVSIMGASGSGKSTLLHVLGGLDAPDAGSVNLLGTDVFSLGQAGRCRLRAQNLGFIFQSYHLLNELTVLENVCLPAQAFGWGGAVSKDIIQRATDLLNEVELGHRLDHKPMELSGGERQRAAIARAMINSPQIVLADEPTGNLDSKTGEHVLECLFNMINQRKGTLIAVTHNSEVAARCSRAVQLVDGCLV